MTENEEIKRRVKKLFALSKSPNENEAALAMKMANDLIGKYNLSQSEINGFVKKGVKSTKRKVEWRTVLANAVEQLYATYHFRDQYTGEFIFYGEELDVFMATEMFSYLSKTINRMVCQNIRKNAKYKFRQSYRAGIANRLYDRIQELGYQCSWRNHEELKAKKSEILEFVNTQVALKNTTSKKTIKANPIAYARGTIDADGVNLSRQMTGSSTRRIEGW